MQGEKNFGNFGHQAMENAGGFQAIQNRHGEIKNDEIGFVLEGFIDGVLAVDGFAANFEEFVILEEAAKSLTHVSVVVRYQDAFGFLAHVR